MVLLNKDLSILTSTVAPTSEGAYPTHGGAKQIIVPNMDKWSYPKKIIELQLNHTKK